MGPPAWGGGAIGGRWRAAKLSIFAVLCLAACSGGGGGRLLSWRPAQQAPPASRPSLRAALLSHRSSHPKLLIGGLSPTLHAPQRSLLQLSPPGTAGNRTDEGGGGPPPLPGDDAGGDSCTGVRQQAGQRAKCQFVRDTEGCSSGTLLEYLQIFYCTFGGAPWLGFGVLGLWLAALFYMLGNTAADYFCPSLEELSEILRLPPTVAGVTLLPLGNGAPDVFASIAAFVGAGQGQVGLNSVLGAGCFVTCVVAGAVCLCVAGRAGLALDRASFIRDVSFYLVSTAALLTISLVGKITLPWAIAFFCIYPVYGVSVAVSELARGRSTAAAAGRHHSQEWLLLRPLSAAGVSLPAGGVDDDLAGTYEPLLSGDSLPPLPTPDGSPRLPQWMWTSHVAIFSQQASQREAPRLMWGWSEDEEPPPEPTACTLRGVLRLLVCVPVNLPRRLTIPSCQRGSSVSGGGGGGGWSKPFGVASMALAPLLLAFVLSGEGRQLAAYLYGGAAGAALALFALLTTEAGGARPPARVAPLWVVAGFVMSVVWFYLIANELVAALVALGAILGIDPALLGLTVLAWGNSVGDAVANLAMASNGKPEGVQVAWSGCYAGPMFNTLVGLGLSLVLASWRARPAVFAVPHDPTLVWTIGFLVLGLLYALVLLPYQNMRPSRALGAGLIGLYLAFMCFRVALIVGAVSVE